MANLKFLDKYSNQTVDELISMENIYRIDSLVLVFEAALDRKVTRVGFHKLSEVEKTILAIEALEREVNNGGYQQFFLNSSKEYVPIIVKALNVISCPKTAHLTQRAITEVNKNINVEDKLSELLEKFDELYFETGESIEDQLFKFIKTHKKDISF